MKKTIIICILAILVLLLPLGVLTTAALTSPCQYDDTFLGELTYKHQRLKSIEEEKIVLIGGSSLAFGLDSKKLEEYLGKPVINYGLYATIGTKAMLDMSRSYINEGDIVVICPETDRQTYSLYYNAMSMWQSLDCDLSMFWDVGFSNYGKLIAKIPEFSNEKLGFIRNNQKPAPTGIYAKSSFNEYGDIAVERPYNEMPQNYDTSSPVYLNRDLLNSEFIDYLNKYAKHCERKGAKVYFSFSPINADAIVSTSEEQEEFYASLKEQLDFPVLSELSDYVMDSAFFYDTNFHLNTIGALERTSILAIDLATVETDTLIHVPRYEPPKRPDNYFATSTDTDQNSKYFEFEEIDGGVAIVGLTEDGKKEKTLTIPQTENGKSVLSLNANAFSGSSVLEHIIIPENSALKGIDLNAFNGANSLSVIELHLAPSALPIDPNVFGNLPDCYVYVPTAKYSEFATDYFWSSMMRFVRTLDELQ